jgi:hypothetical protein
LVGKKRSDLEALLASKKLPIAVETYLPISNSNKVLTYAMPDVKDGTIVVTFSASPIQADTTITSIAFQGTKDPEF